MTEERGDRPRVLCLCLAEEGFPGELAPHFETRVVCDAAAAVQEARSASYHCYLAHGSEAFEPGFDFWSQVRAFDRNTPFLMVSQLPPSRSIEEQLRAGYDIYAAWPCTAYEIMLLIQCLLNSSELRSLRARMEEMRAISEDLKDRMRGVDEQMARAGASMARAEEHMMRAQALKVFTDAGGAGAFFQRYWPEMLNRMLTEQRNRTDENE